MKKLLFLILGILITSTVYSQDTKELVGEVAQMYSDGNVESNGLIAGFSIWGLVAGILFGSIGFVAFVYGKKNSEFRPMFIGIALMAYPYFFRGTIILFLVGVGLTAALYFFRE